MMLLFSKAHLQLVSHPAVFVLSRKVPSQEKEEEQRCVTRSDCLLATPPKWRACSQVNGCVRDYNLVPRKGLGIEVVED